MEDYNSASISRSSRFKDFFSAIVLVGGALLLSFCLINFVFQSYQVDGESMETTLQNNDRLVVWKAGRTWANITGHPYIPNYGDIIIFNQDGLATYGQEDTKQLVKRVVALPGDRIVVKNGAITVYGHDHPKGFRPDQALPYGKEHALPYTDGNIDVTLGSDQLFVCGDNRVNSLDSRTFGPIKLGAVIGRLALRIYPIDHAQSF